MATNKNIIMKQFNGTDYDTLYPKTVAAQIDDVYSKDETYPKSQLDTKSQLYTKEQILTNATKTLYGLGADAVPDAVFVLTKTLVDSAKNSADSKAKIELGSYTGNGAIVSVDKTLNFSFKPKVVIIAGPGDSYELEDYGTAIFMQGAAYSRIDYGLSVDGRYISGYSFDLTWGNSSVTWKSVKDFGGGVALNANGKKYYYVAIG